MSARALALGCTSVAVILASFYAIYVAVHRSLSYLPMVASTSDESRRPLLADITAVQAETQYLRASVDSKAASKDVEVLRAELSVMKTDIIKKLMTLKTATPATTTPSMRPTLKLPDCLARFSMAYAGIVRAAGAVPWWQVIIDPEEDKFVSSAVKHTGSWDTHVGAALDFIISEMPCVSSSGNRNTIVDVGANIGMFAGQAAAQGCNVYAFEPQNATSSCVRATACLNGWDDRVHVHRQPVSPLRHIGMPVIVQGSAQGNVGGVSQSICDRGGASECEWIPSARLDDFDFGNVIAWKTDIEGFDVAALETGEKYLSSKKVPHILFELTPGGFSEDFGATSPKLGIEKNANFMSMLASWGYALAEIPYNRPSATTFEAKLITSSFHEFVTSITTSGSMGLDGEARPFTDIWATLGGPEVFRRYNERYGK